MSSVTLTEGLAPATPAAGRVVIYVKTDSKFYYKDDTGAERVVGDPTAVAVAMAVALG